MEENKKPASEVAVQKQVNVKVEFENINELNDLITEINEKINQLQNFKLKVKTIK